MKLQLGSNAVTYSGGVTKIIVDFTCDFCDYEASHPGLGVVYSSLVAAKKGSHVEEGISIKENFFIKNPIRIDKTSGKVELGELAQFLNGKGWTIESNL